MIELDKNGRMHRVETLAKSEDVAQANVLAQEIFGSRLGIGRRELDEIAANEGLLGVRGPYGEIIAISLLVLQPIVGHAKLAGLKPDEAHSFGTAVHPDHQGNGLGLLLTRVQDVIARDWGKRYITATPLPENIARIKLRLKLGYSIVGYDPYCFGRNEAVDGRLVMQKIFYEGFTYQELSPSGLEEAIERRDPYLFIPIELGEDADMAARNVLSQALCSEYTIVGFIDEDRPSRGRYIMRLLG